MPASLYPDAINSISLTRGHAPLLFLTSPEYFQKIQKKLYLCKKYKKVMTRGRRTCKILKEIRQQIAEKNDVELVISECHFQGECQGTCPKCEEEVRYLENELQKRRQLGKAVAVAGVALGIAGTFSACNLSQQKQENKQTSEWVEIDGDIVAVPGGITHKDSIVWQDIDDDDTTVFVVPEILSEYVGGDEALIKFLQKNLVYPEEARLKGIEGRIIIGFVVEKDGSLTNFKILRGVHPILDNEALRVVKLMPKFIPGKIKNKPVRVQFNIPVTFKLKDE